MPSEPHQTEKTDPRTGIKRKLVHETVSAKTGSNIVAGHFTNSRSPTQSRFAPVIDARDVDVPAFRWSALTRFRPAPTAKRVVESAATLAEPENEQEGGAATGDEPATNANEATAASTDADEEKQEPDKAAIISKYFTTSSTNDSIVAGPASDIKGGKLIQLRLTMTTPQIAAAIEANQGAGSIKISNLQRDWPRAFEILAEEKGVTVQELKGLFNKASDISRARNVGWKWDAASKAKKSANEKARRKALVGDDEEEDEGGEEDVSEKAEEGGGKKKGKRKS